MQSLAFFWCYYSHLGRGGGSSVTEFGIPPNSYHFPWQPAPLGLELSIASSSQSQGLHPGWVDGQIEDHSGSISCPTAPSGRLLFIYTCAHLALFIYRFTILHILLCLPINSLIIQFIVLHCGIQGVIERIFQRQTRVPYVVFHREVTAKVIRR